jgi:hypothetical protein
MLTDFIHYTESVGSDVAVTRGGDHQFFGGLSSVG